MDLCVNINTKQSNKFLCVPCIRTAEFILHDSCVVLITEIWFVNCAQVSLLSFGQVCISASQSLLDSVLLLF